MSFRVIHLYELDYNMLLGITFRKFSHHCENHQLTNDACYGKPNRRACDVVMCDTLQSRSAASPGRHW